MVTAFFERLGNVGVLLLASALLLGGLAGGAVVHHFERVSVETNAGQQQDDKEAQKKTGKNGHGKQKHDRQHHDPAEAETD